MFFFLYVVLFHISFVSVLPRTPATILRSILPLLCPKLSLSPTHCRFDPCFHAPSSDAALVDFRIAALLLFAGGVHCWDTHTLPTSYVLMK